jgi:hypothetical protein
MSSPSVGQLADSVTEVVGDALSTGKELASDAAKHLPEVTESFGKLARSSAETVADLASTAIALAPFVRHSSRRSSRRWMVPVAVLAVVAALAVVKRIRSSRRPTVISGPQALRSTDNVDDLDRSASAKTA